LGSSKKGRAYGTEEIFKDIIIEPFPDLKNRNNCIGGEFVSLFPL
jgi:hypothetical protein